MKGRCRLSGMLGALGKNHRGTIIIEDAYLYKPLLPKGCGATRDMSSLILWNKDTLQCQEWWHDARNYVKVRITIEQL